MKDQEQKGVERLMLEYKQVIVKLNCLEAKSEALEKKIKILENKILFLENNNIEGVRYY